MNSIAWYVESIIESIIGNNIFCAYKGNGNQLGG